MNKKYIAVPGRLESVDTDGQIAGASQVYDDDMQKFQAEVNASSAYLGEDDGEGIKQLKDAEGNNVNPATSTNAVKDAQGNLLSDTLTEVNNKVDALQKQDVVPVDTLPAVVDADPKKIYRVVGTDSYTDHMLNAAGDDFKILATFSFPGIDDEPTADSNNLVTSGGIKAKLNKKVDGRQDSKAFYVTDNNGNIIAKIDKDGVHSVDFKIGEEGDSVANALRNIATQISNAVAEEENRAKAVEATKLDAVLSDNAFYFTDANGYIIAKIDANGVHSVNIEEEPNKIDNDSISIEDSNGYIVAKVDKDGIHSAKDKHAVACMVLSESYYPTAAPTRDSDGNVTYAQVMFETGVAGSINITYTNGNSSSVAVVYGDYNYTITINRDADGNVETVNVQ